MVVAPSADLEMALRAIVFSAVGTAGQRCTSPRRLIVHEEIYDRLVPRLLDIYKRLPIGDPLADGILVGPLIDARAFEDMHRGQPAEARVPPRCSQHREQWVALGRLARSSQSTIQTSSWTI